MNLKDLDRLLTIALVTVVIAIIITGGKLHAKGTRDSVNEQGQSDSALQAASYNLLQIDDLIQRLNSDTWTDNTSSTYIHTLQDLGEYKITAYCPCAICCGKWAKDRPGGIVYGAYGIELVEGVSAAGPFPSGTKLYIEGIGEYVVQDTTSEWVLEENDHKLVDIYFNKHQDAVEFGAKHKNVYLIGGK